MIDVIVPVYAGEPFVRRCLESVLTGGGAAHELVVVDDCSPEPALSAWLDELAATGRITLLRNERNRGFVGAVNRALALHPERDVVLLNSDTEVAGDWLARLLRCAAEHPDAGTVTPFSNNATICSYPFEGWTGALPGTLGLAALDALFARTLPGVVADLPTGVGFCMFMRRACLTQVGVLDEAAFGRGYGEENDLCRRAAKAGWRNLLCAEVFVYHKGGVSFGPGRDALMVAGAAALRRLHPEYERVVRAFIAADPLRPLRAALDEARLALGGAEAMAVRAERATEPVRGAMPPLPPAPVLRSYAGIERWPVAGSALPVADDVPVWLHVLHGWGGGTERWVCDMAGADTQARHLCLRSRTGRNDAGVRLELLEPAVSDEVLLAWNLDEPIAFCAVHHAQWRAIFTTVVAACDVRVVVVSSLIGHALDVFDGGRPTMVVLHDLFPFCPALFGWFGEACETCDEARLSRCFTRNHLNVFWHQAAPQAWLELRAAFARALAGPEMMVMAPSRSVFERYRTLLPILSTVPWHLVPHGLALSPPPLVRRARSAAEAGRQRLRLLVPGRLPPHKGLELIRELLPALADFADVLLLGCGDFGEAFSHLKHVQAVPDYGPAQMAAHVAVFGPDCALLPALLPESFSYTLSEMQALAVPVVATRLGAFAERIEQGVTGWLVAPVASEVLETLRELAAAPECLDAAAAVLRARPVRTAVQMVADYHALVSLTQAAGAPRPRRADQPGLGRALLWQTFAGLHETRGWLNFRMRELDETHRSWQAGDAGLHGRITALEAALAAERDKAEVLRRRALDAEAAVMALHASTSWRLTAPLRYLASALRGAGAVPLLRDETVDATGALAPPPGLVRAGSERPWRGDWQGRWAAALGEGADALRLRAGLRSVCRDALGVPDAARLVIGMGDGDARSSLPAFARAAEAVGAARNGVVFVWLGTLDQAWAEGLGDVLRLPLASRRLFVREEAEFERWLLAGDVYFGCRHAADEDAGAVEARACGLPMVLANGASPSAQGGVAGGLGGMETAGVDAILHALDATEAQSL